MNPHEQLARTKKAYALADYLTANCPETLRRDGALEVMAEMPSTWWTDIADNAGVNAPSFDCIRQVIEILRSRSEAARALPRKPTCAPPVASTGQTTPEGRTAASLEVGERAYHTGEFDHRRNDLLQTCELLAEVQW